MLPGKMPILKIVPERRAGPTRSPRLGNRAGRPRVATPVRCSRETHIQAPCPPPLRRARGLCEQQVQDAGVAGMTQTILAPTSHCLPASATALLPPQAGASVWMPRWRWEAVPSCPLAPTHSAPRSRPSRQGRRSAVAPAPPSGPARRSRQAPAPARRRPAVRSRPRPGPRCLPGALQSAHTSARGPFRDILSGDAAAALWASVGGAGGGPGRRRRPYGPAPARPRRGSARAANRPPPGLARNPPCPPARSPSGALRPAPPRAAPPPFAALPAPCAARAAPAGSSAGPAHRGRGARTQPRRSAPRPRLSARGSLRAGLSGRGLLKEPRPSPACSATQTPVGTLTFTFRLGSGPEAETDVVGTGADRKHRQARCSLRSEAGMG